MCRGKEGRENNAATSRRVEGVERKELGEGDLGESGHEHTARRHLNQAICGCTKVPVKQTTSQGQQDRETGEKHEKRGLTRKGNVRTLKRGALGARMPQSCERIDPDIRGGISQQRAERKCGGTARKWVERSDDKYRQFRKHVSGGVKEKRKSPVVGRPVQLGWPSNYEYFSRRCSKAN